MLRDCLFEVSQLRPRVNIRFFNVVKTAAADHGQDEVAAQIWQREKAGSKRMPVSHHGFMDTIEGRARELNIRGVGTPATVMSLPHSQPELDSSAR